MDRDWAKTCDRISAILNCELLNFPKASELRERRTERGKKKARKKAYTKEVPATAPASVLCCVMTEDLLVCSPLVSSLSSSLSRGRAIRCWLLFTLSLSRERQRETMPLGTARSSRVQTWFKAESREKCQLRPRVRTAFIRSPNGYVSVLAGY